MKQNLKQFNKKKSSQETFNNTFLLIVDLNHTIKSFNFQSKEYVYQLTEKHLKFGESIFDYFTHVYSKGELRFFYNVLKNVQNGKSRNIEISFPGKDSLFWLEIYVNPLLNKKNEIDQLSIVAHDITEKKRSEQRIVNSLKEKEILLQEVHHRVKNNMQVISSILNIQSSFVEDATLLEILQECRNRIRAMSIIHEDIYHTLEFGSIDFSDYIINLSSNLISVYCLEEDKIHIQYNMDHVRLNLDQAVPCGLLVNELVSNSIKHAFPGERKGQITITLKEKDNHVFIEISDDGIGLNQDVTLIQKDTLGLQLVSTLAEQIDARIETSTKKGTSFIITFESMNPVNP